jgi:hypothetical protein
MIDDGSPVDPANREPGFYNGPLEVFHLLRLMLTLAMCLSGLAAMAI